MPPGLLQFLHGQLIEGVPKLPSTDLTGRTYVVTGANSGLGLDCVKHLMRLNAARVVIGCRNVTKGEEARESALSSSESNPQAQDKHNNTTELLVWPIDLSRFTSVTDFAARCTTELDRLDGVVANAGVFSQQYIQAEGYEQTLTVNVLSTFLLAKALLPKLRDSATRYDILPRITIVGSAVHFFADTKDIRQIPPGKVFETLTRNGNVGDPEGKTDWTQRYNLSKLLVAMCVQELAERVQKQENERGEPFVVVNDVHPGYCRTGLFRDADSVMQGIGLKVIGRSSEEGSRSLVHGLLAGRESHGKYMGEGRVKSASPFLETEDGKRVQREVWEEVMGKLEPVRPGIEDI
ncbi:MAG: hypothetical protein M1831_006840 [Alyxoria varia]|nr:MAG: hypothetical protein M1831_006840 [Alyxoria varia]